ncbi:hypothetical protein PR048_028148 [Dryococelus australis]|uniref:Uncharacterized protein n=1 Tax=Dryococelus australis TaxID=614101 RepID=A0ABQ9GIG5_9NEOP|nr:hypothetical protein PR048_028148 [Dryococelus australis]
MKMTLFGAHEREVMCSETQMVAPSWFETRSEIGSKIDTENCCTIRVQSWTGDRDEVHFKPPKLAVRNLDPRSAAIVNKCKRGGDTAAHTTQLHRHMPPKWRHNLASCRNALSPIIAWYSYRQEIAQPTEKARKPQQASQQKQIYQQWQSASSMDFLRPFMAFASTLSNVSFEVLPSQPHETQSVSNIKEGYQSEHEDEVTCHTLGEQSTENVSDRDSGNFVYTMPEWDTSTSGRKRTVMGKPSTSVSSVDKVFRLLVSSSSATASNSSSSSDDKSMPGTTQWGLLSRTDDLSQGEFTRVQSRWRAQVIPLPRPAITLPVPASRRPASASRSRSPPSRLCIPLPLPAPASCVGLRRPLSKTIARSKSMAQEATKYEVFGVGAPTNGIAHCPEKAYTIIDRLPEDLGTGLVSDWSAACCENNSLLAVLSPGDMNTRR